MNYGFFTIIIGWGKDVFFFHFISCEICWFHYPSDTPNRITYTKRREKLKNRIWSDDTGVWFEHTKRCHANQFSLSFHDFLFQPFWKPILTHFYIIQWEMDNSLIADKLVRGEEATQAKAKHHFIQKQFFDFNFKQTFLFRFFFLHFFLLFSVCIKRWIIRKLVIITLRLWYIWKFVYLIWMNFTIILNEKKSKID